MVGVGLAIVAVDMAVARPAIIAVPNGLWLRWRSGCAGWKNASDLALGRRQGHAALHLASCGGGGWGFRLDFDEDEGADSDAAAERKQAADCERGTRRAAQDEQVSAPMAVRAACERMLDYKGVAHPRRR